MQSLWIDSQGQAHVNDPMVFRVGNSFSSCVVIAEGLACQDPPDLIVGLEQAGAAHTDYGLLTSQASHAGTVVDGNAADFNSVCWLTSNGRVSCMELDLEDLALMEPPALKNYFVGKRVLALGINGYSHGRDRCAAMSDGSLWCIGSNLAGKFGTAGELNIETQVQPPASVRIRSHPDA